MQNNIALNVPFLLKKYWFQLAIAGFVIYAIGSKDFSFQFNINNPDTENSIDAPHKSQNAPGKKATELITQNNSTPPVVKSEAGFFSKIPFIGGGSSSTKKKSELAQIDLQTVQSYIKRFAHVAINERKKYGVPASIIISNGLFHSFAGKRDMAQAGNNHFGISCTSDWNGSNGTYTGMCYKHYENAWTSFRDHSLFVTSGKYENLRQLSSTDYKGWAKNLEANGFSEFEDLEKNLIDLIEKFELQQLDYQ